nr:hypothetical protein [Tanacetum cinerariifolium]
MSVRTDITAIEDSNLVFLRNNNEPVWLDLTVSTYCQWTFKIDPGVDENQPPNGNANRQLTYALPAVLLAQRSAKPDTTTAALLNSLYGDFDAPDLTAPTLLGVATSQVTKPANTKAFAISLLGAGASYPEVGKGVGVEIAPVQFIQRSVLKGQPNLNRSLKSYAQWRNRLGRSLTISAAQTSTDSSALFDQTDPLLDTIYNNRLAHRLRHLQERTNFNASWAMYNSTVALSQDAFLNNTGIFPNTAGVYTGTQLALDAPKLTRFSALMAP